MLSQVAVVVVAVSDRYCWWLWSFIAGRYHWSMITVTTCPLAGIYHWSLITITADHSLVSDHSHKTANIFFSFDSVA